MREPANPERDRAMFDDVDRKYLRGVTEYIDGLSRQAKYNRREQIINRLTGGIRDFVPAHRHMDKLIWENLLDLPREDETRLKNGMVSAIALFYEIHEALNLDFGRTLKRAIEEAYLYGQTHRDLPRREVRDVDLDVDIEEPTGVTEIHDRVLEKVRNGDELTDREVRIAVQYRPDQETISTLQKHFKNRKQKESREDWLEDLEKNAEMHAEEEGLR